MAIISVDHLSREFARPEQAAKISFLKSLFSKKKAGSFDAVTDLSFTVETADKIAFIGPNGAGKSTTIKMLCGLLRPTSGEARVTGLCPWNQREELTRRIGIVFGQRSALWQALPVRDSFDLLAKIYDLEPAAYRAQKDSLVALFRLEGLLDQSAGTLSLGQRMRCDLAAALLHRPEVLFLDEPTIGLDVTAKSFLRDHLNALAAKQETTIILTSHDTDDIEKICDRVILIDHGKKLLDTTVPNLRRAHTRHKTIRLSTEEEAPHFEAPGVTQAEAAPHHLLLKIDVREAALEQVVSACLARFNVLDIAIGEVPLEDVIKNIYAGKGGEGA